MAQQVWTFFYGSFINLHVLKNAGFVPERHEVARLSGFDIRIQPLANQAPASVRRRHVSGREVLAGERGLARTAGANQDDEGQVGDGDSHLQSPQRLLAPSNRVTRFHGGGKYSR
jgi:hypothetical protein